MNKILRYILALVAVFAPTALVSFFITSQISTWYATVIKPDFTPPEWVFAPVWILLYLLMALALARVWNTESSATRKKWLFTFVVQLCLNILWSILFFSLHGFLSSAIEIVVLWFSVVVLTLCSWEVDRVSFWLLIPYLAWVTFAMILNIGIWWIN
jgi:benzodiazapine receptor